MMYSFESIDKPVGDTITAGGNILTGNLENFIKNNFESNDNVFNRRRVDIERRIESSFKPTTWFTRTLASSQL